MATYAVGDIQGCSRSFWALLEHMGFDPASDRLWLVGDLVNRGPGSLEVLRICRELGGALTAVLGNHDLHLLAAAAGMRPASPKDTFSDVLQAPDREELLAWLAERPFVHRETVAGREHLLVHAGLHPSWSLQRACELSAEAGRALQKKSGKKLLKALAEPAPRRWRDELEGKPRLAALVAWFTRARAATKEGRLETDFTGPKDAVPKGSRAWFELAERKSAGSPVVFGHWAGLGLHLTDDLLGLDTGCVWGGQLTAVRLEDRQVFAVPCADAVNA